MQIQRHPGFERRIECADVCHDGSGVGRPVRIDAQRGPDNLDERAIRRDVAKRAAAALQQRHVARILESPAKFEYQPALSKAGLADDLDDAPLA